MCNSINVINSGLAGAAAGRSAGGFESGCKRRIALAMMGVSLVFVLAFTPQANAQWVGGPVLIGGDETDSAVLEGTIQPGKLYAKQAFDFLGEHVTNGNKVVVCLGCHTTPEEARLAFELSFAASGLPGLEWTRFSIGTVAGIHAFFDGTGTFNVNNTGIIYMPSRQPDVLCACPPCCLLFAVFGGLTQAELNNVNLNKAILKDFVKGTGGITGFGGLFTHQLRDFDNAYEWLTDPIDGLVPEIQTSTPTNVVDDQFLHLTCDAKTAFFPDVSPADVDAIAGPNAWFTRFKDKDGYTGLGGLTPVGRSKKHRLTGVVFEDIIVLGAPLPPPVAGPDCDSDGVPDACGPDCNSNGVPDTCDVAAGSPDCDGNGVLDECNADCNSNGVPDDCDIQNCEEGELSCGDCDQDGVMNSCETQDCDDNGVSDDCDILSCAGDTSCEDCNVNGLLDVCEISECPEGDTTCSDCDSNGVPDVCDPDCNSNGVPDACDITAGSSDCDGDGIPDDCDLIRAALHPAPPHDIRKNRFVSFDPNNCANNVAFKIELIDRACSTTGKKCMVAAECMACVNGSNNGSPCTIQSDCTGGGSCVLSGETCNEQAAPVLLGWVGDPFLKNTPDTYTSLVVGAMPPFRQWTEGVIHVGDCEIAPAQTYAISATGDGATFSDPLLIGTIVKPQGKEWGDLVGNFTGMSWTAPNGLVGVDDVLAMIKFITLKPAPHITVVDLDDEVPNFLINATDLGLVLMGFKGDPYPPPDFCNQGPVADCLDVPCNNIVAGPPFLFALVPNSAFIDTDGTVRVDVFVDDVTDLGAYDIALEVTGGTNGTLTLVEIVIENFCVGGTDDGKLCADAADCTSPGVCVVRPDYVFVSGGGTEACDTVAGRIANANSISGVAVTGSGYLGTFVYQATGCATGDFTIAMKPGDDITFINNGDGLLLPSTPDLCTVIGVGYDCFDAADCDPIACQTATCVSNACNYTNDPSGTSCDDGEYCTTTDTCDGNGVCVGSGTPCERPPNIFCCESTDSCYDDVFLFCSLQFP